MVLIPGGWFFMGSDDSDSQAQNREKPRHLHYLKPFYISIACVTVAKFKKFADETGYRGGDYTGTGDDWKEQWGKWRDDPPDHPVRYVNRHDADAYCKWAGLRLPAEAEWELAARGYTGLKYPWGNDWEEGRRVCWGKQKGPEGETAPVHDHPKGASPFGAFQQSGNLWEWCEDWFDDNAYQRYAEGDFSLPAEGGRRVLRGGSWSDLFAEYFRSADRFDYNPEGRDYDYGFRSAKTVIF